jgi:hypothetical protein
MRLAIGGMGVGDDGRRASRSPDGRAVLDSLHGHVLGECWKTMLVLRAFATLERNLRQGPLCVGLATGLAANC